MSVKSGVKVKKSKKRGVTIDEVYAQLSQKKEYGPEPDIPPVVLTPRSAEACLLEGVDPEELKLRDLDSFW